MLDAPIGRLGLSEPLRQFVAEFPYERESILAFVMRAAGELPAAARVLDVGAGDSPFRELFDHTRYTTLDWAQSPHEGATAVDIVASADKIPVRDEAFDAALLTQVLEHVPEPAAVLGEIHRVLVPGGRVYLTAPFAWELHELPHDYYRYTPEGLRHVMTTAGFGDVEVEARNDSFTTLAQLMSNVRWHIGRSSDGLDDRRQDAGRLLGDLAEEIAKLAALDTERRFPLGYSAVGVRQ